jgi:hypothetical protein
MAKLEIIQSQAKVATSTTPRTSTLALPISLASTVGSGFSAVGKAIADIQKDIYALEDQNQVNKLLPDVNTKIQKEYDKYLKSIDTNAPQKFEKDISNKAFEQILKNANPTVKKLILNKIAEKKALLKPKLTSQITSNNIDQLSISIDNAFDAALTSMLSSDLSDKAVGAKSFENLLNNKVYEKYLGAEVWNSLKDKKLKLRNKLLLNSEIEINPKGVIRSKEELLKAVGPVETDRIMNRAKENIISDRTRAENVERFQLLINQETQNDTFAELLIRINNSKRNPSDENLLNEVPTIQELHEMYDLDLINEAMFVKLSDFLAQPERMDAKSDDELFTLITEIVLSADAIEMLGDIKNTIFGEDVLKDLALEDAEMFGALLNTAKGDYTKHRDYKNFLTTLKGNIANIDRVRSRKAQILKKDIADFENSMIKKYTRKVNDGMTPENAYLSTMEESFPVDLVPALNSLPFPERIGDFKSAIEDAKGPDNFFKNQYRLVFENYKKSRKSKFDMKQMIQDLDDIDFLKDVFQIKMKISNNNLDVATREADIFVPKKSGELGDL